MSKYTRTVLLLFAVLLVGCNGAGNALDDPVRHEGRYKVVYHANESSSGDEPTDSAWYRPCDSVSVLSNTGDLSKDGYSFMGWNTKADGSGETYPSKGTFDMGDSDVDLYAKWSCGTLKETISNFSFVDIASDVNGNVFFLGKTFLKKQDPFGFNEWTKTVEGDLNFLAIDCDNVGNVYVAGYVSGIRTCDFGNNVSCTTLSQNKNTLLVKYNSLGVAQWAKVSTSGVGFINHIGVSFSGDIYAIGTISSTQIDFGDSVIVSGESLRSFLVKYSAEGKPLWAKTTESSSDDIFTDVAVDNNENVYICGTIVAADNLDFGNNVVVTGRATGTSSLLVKYNSTGIPLWAVTDLSASGVNICIQSLSVDSNGNPYIAGSIADGIGIFGSWVTITPATTEKTMLLIKYNSKGIPLWGRTLLSDTSEADISSLVVDYNGNVFVSGVVHRTPPVILLNGKPVSTIVPLRVVEVGNNISFNLEVGVVLGFFLVCYSSDGIPVWACSSSWNSLYTAMSVSASGEIYLSSGENSSLLVKYE